MPPDAAPEQLIPINSIATRLLCPIVAAVRPRAMRSTLPASRYGSDWIRQAALREQVHGLPVPWASKLNACTVQCAVAMRPVHGIIES